MLAPHQFLWVHKSVVGNLDEDVESLESDCFMVCSEAEARERARNFDDWIPFVLLTAVAQAYVDATVGREPLERVVETARRIGVKWDYPASEARKALRGYGT